MRQVNAVFNTNRMVSEYTNRFYVPCDKHYKELSENNRQRARELAAWLDKIGTEWHNVQITEVSANGDEEQKVGDILEVTAKVKLTGLQASDVIVQAFYGQIVSAEDLPQGDIVDLQFVRQEGDIAEFNGGIGLATSGKMGLAVRVLPNHKDLIHPFLTGYIVCSK